MKTGKTISYGIIALVALIGFSIAACDDGGEDDGMGGTTITFNANGGSGTPPKPMTMQFGGITLPSGNDLSKVGYTFGGWNTDATYRGEYYPAGSDYRGKDVTLYAMWFVGTFTPPAGPNTGFIIIRFNVNGGSGTPPISIPMQEYTSISVPDENGLSKTACVFGGWNTKANGTGTTYNAGESYTPVHGEGSGAGYDTIFNLYAMWYDASVCTVIFNVNGGNNTIPNQTVQPGYSSVLPSSGLSMEFATFTGWNTKADGSGTNYTSTYTPTGNNAVITLYAQWDITPLSSVDDLGDKLRWLKTYAQSNSSYTLELLNEDNLNNVISPTTLSYSGKNNITVTLRGVGANRSVHLWDRGAMFIVDSGVTLVLDNNITLQGLDANHGYHSNNNDALVRVNLGGTLVMNAGSTITGNANTYNNATTSGGGVYVNGTFTMNGGTISDNTTRRYGGVTIGYIGGGGVYVGASGAFTMSGGTISDNTSGVGGGVCVGGTFTMSGGTISGNTSDSGSGGGVYVRGGTFTMSGGKISRNTVSPSYPSPSTSLYGGGVHVGDGTFIMSGGEISDNTVSPHSLSSNPSFGGGVHIGDGTFIISDTAKISRNTAATNGGGVSGSLTMSGGTISGNTAGSNGGGVSGSLTMSGGTISGNTAGSNGGGVSGSLTKTGGTIYGYSTDDMVNSNIVKNSSGTIVSNQGHAVYATGGNSTKRMETTAGPGVNLSFNGSNGNFTGNWDY